MYLYIFLKFIHFYGNNLQIINNCHLNNIMFRLKKLDQ